MDVDFSDSLGDPLTVTDRLAFRRISHWLNRETRKSSTFEAPGLAAIGTSIGLVRTENQDRALLARFNGDSPNNSFLLLALCDGLGGMVEGGKCAEVALSVVITYLLENPNEASASGLRSALLVANQEIYKLFQANGGTTIAAVLVPKTNPATAASVGDSRIYIQPRDGALKQLSADDSIAGELNRLGVKRDIEPNSDLFGGRLTQFLGVGPEMEPHLYPLQRDLQGKLLMTSDGAHGAHQSVIQALVANATNAQAAAQRLIQLATWTGGRDNATVICGSLEAILHGPDSGSSEKNLLELWDSNGSFELIVEVDKSRNLEVKKEYSPRPWYKSFTERESPAPKPPRKRKTKTKLPASVESKLKPSMQIDIADAPTKPLSDATQPNLSEETAPVNPNEKAAAVDTRENASNADEKNQAPQTSKNGLIHES